MVQCDFKQYPSVFYELKIKGHAEYNPGNDIVCSAVSALAYTLLYAAIDAGAKTMNYQDKPGDYYCYIDLKKAKDDVAQKVNTIFRTIYLGIEQIAKSYPDNAKVNISDYAG